MFLFLCHLCRHAVAYRPRDQASGLLALSCQFGKEPQRKQKVLTPHRVFPFHVQSSERVGQWRVWYQESYPIREGKAREHQAEFLRTNPGALGISVMAQLAVPLFPPGGGAAVSFG